MLVKNNAIKQLCLGGLLCFLQLSLHAQSAKDTAQQMTVELHADPKMKNIDIGYWL